MIDGNAQPTATSDRPALRHASDRSPITLAFLFYLVTVGGIISACLGTLAGNPAATRESLEMAMMVCGGIGMVIGFLLGLLRFRSWKLAAWGTLSGLFVGLIAAALTMISAEDFLQVNLIASIGGWLMIVVMCLTARYKAV